MSKHQATEFANKEQILMNSLTNFFSENNCENMHIMRKIVEREDSLISLRILDFFVTTYCKKKGTITDGNKFHTLHLEYKGQLRGVQKSAFDPFRRKDRIQFSYDPDNPSVSIDTTVGQLNFFRWIIKYGVLDYIRDNFKEINEAMILNMKEKEKLKARKREQKAEERKKENAVVPIVKNSLVISRRQTKQTTEMVVTFN